jgi:hypothetical protein
VDDYQKSGPKTPKAASREREQEMRSQMRYLLAIDDENTLVSILKSKYGFTPRDPQYAAIMQIWNDAQQRLRRER